ncbi:hypothetical protein [Candidatus Poriferisodalis sp.]|uniref:hypothetical protein n=1 Tax=Candidatus Poriferisodalis sp. TaxID=3101277 RepID=UPI003B5BA005
MSAKAMARPYRTAIVWIGTDTANGNVADRVPESSVVTTHPSSPPAKDRSIGQVTDAHPLGRADTEGNHDEECLE